jgi:hypothetical protein
VIRCEDKNGVVRYSSFINGCNMRVTNGPHLYYDNAGKLVRDQQAGRAGNLGNKHELKMSKRSEHPILTGLPDTWIHTQDECYSELRGPQKRSCDDHSDGAHGS